MEVKAGDGGNGCVSFRREKYVPRGGPNGGNGGNGGSCLVRAKEGLYTLMDVKYRKRFEAKHGEHGMGQNMFGRKAEDVVIIVPVGTVVKDEATGKILGDLTVAGAEIVVAKGGKGGRGNTHFATSVRQAPRIAEDGVKGEARRIRLELKLLADIGLVGFPNAGKSTFISAISNARPKIADYPFTTKTPCLGMVRLDEERSFVVADIPGLIEGAHRGVGMGIQFLKHIERTRLLLHLLDLSDPTCEDPKKTYEILRSEMKNYHPALLEKPEIVVLTKQDCFDSRAQEKKVKKIFEKMGKKVFLISAVKREGLAPLLNEAFQMLTCARSSV